MNDYEERKQARIDRYREKAEKARQQSSQLSHESVSMLEHIPPGQSILVGHHSERGHRKMLERNTHFRMHSRYQFDSGWPAESDADSWKATVCSKMQAGNCIPVKGVHLMPSRRTAGVFRKMQAARRSPKQGSSGHFLCVWTDCASFRALLFAPVPAKKVEMHLNLRRISRKKFIFYPARFFLQLRAYANIMRGEKGYIWRAGHGIPFCAGNC